MAGTDWLAGFSERYPNLIPTFPTNCSPWTEIRIRNHPCGKMTIRYISGTVRKDFPLAVTEMLLPILLALTLVI